MSLRPHVVCWSIVAVVSLSACGTIGEKEFACPGRPAGVRCMSASDVYRATQHSNVVEPTSARALGDEPQRSDAREAPHVSRASASMPGDRSKESRKPGAEPLPAHPPVLGVDRPLPIRTPAQVMRVWIAPWEDVRGVLHGGEHAFIEIVERRWSVGEREASEPVRFFSLQTPPASAPTVAKEGKPAKAPSAASRPEPSTDRHSSPQGVSR